MRWRARKQGQLCKCTTTSKRHRGAIFGRSAVETVHNRKWTVHSAQPTVHSPQFTVHSAAFLHFAEKCSCSLSWCTPLAAAIPRILSAENNAGFTSTLRQGTKHQYVDSWPSSNDNQCSFDPSSIQELFMHPPGLQQQQHKPFAFFTQLTTQYQPE